MFRRETLKFLIVNFIVVLTNINIRLYINNNKNTKKQLEWIWQKRCSFLFCSCSVFLFSQQTNKTKKETNIHTT